MKLRALLTSTALVASALGAVAAGTQAPTVPAGADSAAQPEGYFGAGYWEEIDFPSMDGTMLHADILLPDAPENAPEGGWPVVFSIGPYFGEGQSAAGNDPLATGPEPRFQDFIEGADIFANGYAWAQVDSRGYGSSAGCNDYGGIGEQMDVFAASEYFGEAEWSNGHVGMWGKSYDAWTQVMGLAMNPPHLDAVVIQSPIIDGYKIAFDNGVHWDSGWYVTPGLYTLYDANPPAPQHTSPTEWVQWLDSTASLATCWPEQHAYSDLGYDENLEYWRERELVSRAKDSEIPVFWSMGFNDINTKPTNMLPLTTQKEGYLRGWYGQWTHIRGNETGRPEEFFAETLDFFDRFLKGEEFANDLNAQELSRIETNFGEWYVADAYPPSDMQYFDLELDGGTYVDDLSADQLVFATEPAPHTVHMSGAPRVTVDVSTQLPNANMIVHLYDVADGGRSVLIARGAQLLTASGEFVFETWPTDYVLEEGHRLAFAFGADDAEYNPIPTQQTVTINSATVSLPFLTEQIEYEFFGDTVTASGPVASVDGFSEVAFTWPPHVR